MSGSDLSSARLSTYAFPTELTVDELLLRAPTEEDIDVVAPAFVDPDVGGEAGLPPVDADQLRWMLRDQLPQLHATGQLAPYVITRADDGTILGGANLRGLDPMRDSLEIGYWLFAAARGRGVATRAAGALVEHAFANGIYRVEAHVRIGNAGSERVLERLGFVREGIRRRYLRHGGKRVDATLFARLADDA
jgi:RimJ/RimL family protein N-acetyltransferase